MSGVVKDKFEIFKLKDLFNIYESNLYELIINRKYQPVTKLIKLKNNILKNNCDRKLNSN